MKFEIMVEKKYKFQTIGQAFKNISDIFKNGEIINSDRETEILLSYFLKMNRSSIYINSDRELKVAEKLELVDMVKKRLKRIPIQYIT
ncbi:MAG: hypothetical protein WBF28_07660, partial [Atribacterota bacterium]